MWVTLRYSHVGCDVHRVTIRGSFVPSGSADEVPFEFARAELNSTGKAKFKGVKCKLQGISQVSKCTHCKVAFHCGLPVEVWANDLQ